MLRGSSVISLLREVKISAMKKVFVFDLKREKKEKKNESIKKVDAYLTV